MDYTNPDIVESIIKYSPVGFLFQIKKKLTGRYKVAVFTSRLMREKRLGLSVNDAYEKIKEQDAEDFRKERIDTETILIEMRKVASESKDDREIVQTKELIKLWEDKARRDREAELKSAGELAELWLEFTKNKMKLDEENRGSRLNFFFSSKIFFIANFSIAL